MIKLFSLKQQKEKEKSSLTEAGSGVDSGSSGDNKSRSGSGKISAAQIRLQKDLSELEVPDTMKLEIPDMNNLLDLSVLIKPDEGFYKHASIPFSFKFKSTYPHDPPKVTCLKKIFHPNVDIEGNVCLNILREDWKPVLNLQSILIGLQFLILEPNPEDPLNKDAANLLRQNVNLFRESVRKSLNGGSINGEKFEKLL